jgi:CheY-like chemotaxis protein
LALAQPMLDERQHRMIVDCPLRDTFVEGDEVRLTQILANLLNNAARYTDPGGSIELRVASALGSDGSEGVELRVEDTGRGIPTELLPRVFDLFVQERSGGGLGIGLTLVKQLVTMHGGTVAVQSEGPGRGSTFSVWLPSVSAPAPSVRPPAPVQLGRALRVTLVEDNDDVRALMSELLVQWGHSVSEAATGASGVSLIVSELPDIAFVDIGLPDMDGYDVARHVRAALGPGQPRLVALSGFGQQRDREQASLAGFDEHLAKPASPDALRRLLEAASLATPTASAARAVRC